MMGEKKGSGAMTLCSLVNLGAFIVMFTARRSARKQPEKSLC